MVREFIEICKRYKSGLLSPLQLIIHHYPVYQWLLLSKNLVYTPAQSLFFSSSSPPPPHIHSALSSLTRTSKKNKNKVTTEMCALEEKLHFPSCWLKL